MAETHILQRLNDILFFNGNSILFSDLFDDVACDEAYELCHSHLHQLTCFQIKLLDSSWPAFRFNSFAYETLQHNCLYLWSWQTEFTLENKVHIVWTTQIPVAIL